jgi:membrane-associated progesterone receptor component
MTMTELSKCNGRNGAPIYLAITGKVFDVTASAAFYGTFLISPSYVKGPDAMYGAFAGGDASRGLALNSFDAEVVNCGLEGLDEEELQSLQEWRSFFMGMLFDGVMG